MLCFLCLVGGNGTGVMMRRFLLSGSIQAYLGAQDLPEIVTLKVSEASVESSISQ